MTDLDAAPLLNPFKSSNSDETIARLLTMITEAPPFGSPENLAELAAAEKKGRELMALVWLPTNTLPH